MSMFNGVLRFMQRPAASPGRSSKERGSVPIWRRIALLFVLFQLSYFGLFFVISGMAYWMFKPKPTTPVQLVASWRWYGMMRPNAAEVEFLRARLPESLDALRSGVESPSDTVRECTAIAIEELGSDAKAVFAPKHKNLNK